MCSSDLSQLAQACEDACEANRDIRSTPPQREADDVASAVAADAARPCEDFRIPPDHEDDFSAAELDAAYCTVAAIEYAASDNAQDATRARKKEEKALANLMRDLFGNPFKSVRFLPAWRTDTTTALAKQIYESRDFGAMPILADALQDAGCNNEEVLAHCRDPKATHVRGCWVVDLVLGKS